MSTGPKLLIAAALAAALALPSGAFAGQDAPQVKTQNGIRYVSGGVGRQSERAMKSIQSRFNLRLTMETQTGEYMGGASVRIQNAKDKTVLDTTTNGPLLYAKLPPGKYDVRVEGHGESFQKSVTVPKNGHEQLAFRWKQPSTHPND